MRCLICGAETRVLETRYKEDQFKNSRKRRCTVEPKHEFFTEEIPRVTLRGLAGPKLYAKQIQENLKGIQKRNASQERLAELEKALRGGKTVQECMQQFSLCESYVRKRKALLKKRQLAGQALAEAFHTLLGREPEV